MSDSKYHDVDHQLEDDTLYWTIAGRQANENPHQAKKNYFTAKTNTK